MVGVRPPDLDFRFILGVAPRMLSACVQGRSSSPQRGGWRYETYRLGEGAETGLVQEMATLVGKHGFTSCGARSLERAVSDAELEAVSRRAKRAQLPGKV